MLYVFLTHTHLDSLTHTLYRTLNYSPVFTSLSALKLFLKSSKVIIFIYEKNKQTFLFQMKTENKSEFKRFLDENFGEINYIPGTAQIFKQANEIDV